MDKDDSAVTTATSSNDDQEVDEFVSSHGFEFIDGDNDSRARALDSDDDSIGEFFPCTHARTPVTPTPLSAVGTLHTAVHSKLTLGSHGSQQRRD